MSVPTPLTTGELKDLVLKELEFIQAIINRMASNSFQLKGWLIGILSFIMAFNHEAFFANSAYYVGVLAMPVLIFWYLDAFFLYTEQRYRDLYQHVVKTRVATLVDGAGDAWKDFYNLDYTRFEDHRVARKAVGAHLLHTLNQSPLVSLKDHPSSTGPNTQKKVSTIFRVMFSKTLLPFYSLPLIFITIQVFVPRKATEEKIQKIQLINQQPATPELKRLETAPSLQPADTSRHQG